MFTREILSKLMTREFNMDEKSIILLIAEQTVGYHCYLRHIKTSFFIEKLNLPRSTIFQYLKSLRERKVIYCEKVKGQRGLIYALDNDYFERTYPGKIENVYYLDSLNVRDSRKQKSGTPDVKGPCSRTSKTQPAAPRANSAGSKHILNIRDEILLNLSERGLREFLEKRSTNSKRRWTEIVKNILTDHPEDEATLWLAITLVLKSNKDLLGNPIRSSVLGLFEKTEWPIMKGAMMGILKQQQEEAEKKKQREENQALVEATRKRVKQEAEESLKSPSPYQEDPVVSMDDFFARNGGRRRK